MYATDVNLLSLVWFCLTPLPPHFTSLSTFLKCQAFMQPRSVIVHSCSSWGTIIKAKNPLIHHPPLQSPGTLYPIPMTMYAQKYCWYTQPGKTDKSQERTTSTQFQFNLASTTPVCGGEQVTEQLVIHSAFQPLAHSQLRPLDGWLSLGIAATVIPKIDFPPLLKRTFAIYTL